ncbi:EAL domain-containing protein [Pararhodobacter aggregans]|uniref:EAL domain-containing protein n=1 Tax=Pararhodobacter aggregans TaxID=404875 RepID=A0A2T7UXL6_9RHOB|nr:EAL domain-containing protein [Pararhodobacter aggregans]PTX05234.1 EAL domain-containing protein (putative c-di-GMP-specific phosphodiesterase class I) [Pararhodobacter aggregans]PVE49530.1 EAL domain-containing protein [Pararhodobacter aggregans]
MSTPQNQALPEDGYDSPLSVADRMRQQETIDMVRRALDEKRAMLAYQPVVQARMTNRAAFYEAYIRILDDKGRVIPARDFMGAVETHEIGRRIDCLALELGLAALAKEHSIRLSVNMSARSIGYPQWLATLERGLRADPTIAERLILEITEGSAMLMPDLVTVFMADMQSRGICFALDDFGAGYTAFRYLKDFYFDIIKIDGQFIRGIAHDPDNQVLAAALVSIARHFDMFTVAESVENEEDARYLIDIGFDCLQGYFYGIPSTEAPWLTSRLSKLA